MAMSSTTVWTRGFSENPAGAPLRLKSIIEMLDHIGDEWVTLPGGAPAGDAGTGNPAGGVDQGRAMTRRELLARVLWTRAIMDADGAATRLIIEYLDGKPDEWGETTGEAPRFCADDYALAEALLREGSGSDGSDFSR